jgi:hypothetical protein
MRMLGVLVRKYEFGGWASIGRGKEVLVMKVVWVLSFRKC